MIYRTGTKLTDRETGAIFVVTGSDPDMTHYQGSLGSGRRISSEIPELFIVDDSGVPNALDTQVGGDHYKKLGDYQPWQVLRAWLTPEEFRGYMKGTAIAYLARERDKGGMEDVRKACHTLQGLIELAGED